MLNWNLSPLMLALVEAAERLGGGGPERVIHREAASFGENGRYGADSHFAKGTRELVKRGIFRKGMTSRREYWLTEEAWRDRGHDGPPPGSNQIELFG